MTRTVIVILLGLVATANANSDDQMNLSLGGGISVADTPGWAIRLTQTLDITPLDHQGAIGATIMGYEYWRGGPDSGFDIPIGFEGGVRSGRVRTTLGGGVGLLALESWHHDAGFGIVPFASATLGVSLDARRTVTIDGRLQRHVLAGADDFTTWSVLLMIGKAMGD